ncbi:MAG: DUF3667 domain-containing protein [Parafilimonas sp.]
MSHGKARKEKYCLNCNAEVTGRFCSVCGQENIEPKETLWELTTHFTYDLFHYDGKFFSSLKILLLRPGILTHEYVRGRRASYLHPIRMYVFTSAIFFIIFLSFIVGKDASNLDASQLNSREHIAIDKSIDKLEDSIAKTKDPATKAELQKNIIALQKIPSLFSADSTASEGAHIGTNHFTLDTSNHSANFLSSKLPATLAEYKQQQAELSPNKKDGWFNRIVSNKLIEINEKYRYNKKGFIDDFSEHFFHSFPTMMFVSLPVVALILQLLYIRRRKQFTYVQHGVFSVHIYIAAYIFILVIYGLSLLKDVTHWSIFGYLSVLGGAGIFYYVYKSMQNFYEQKRGKTILKFFLFLLVYYIVLILLMVSFIMTSIIAV